MTVPDAVAFCVPARVAVSFTGVPDGTVITAPVLPKPDNAVVSDVAALVTVSTSPFGPQVLAEAMLDASPE